MSGTWHDQNYRTSSFQPGLRKGPGSVISAATIQRVLTTSCYQVRLGFGKSELFVSLVGGMAPCGHTPRLNAAARRQWMPFVPRWSHHSAESGPAKRGTHCEALPRVTGDPTVMPGMNGARKGFGMGSPSPRDKARSRLGRRKAERPKGKGKRSAAK